MIRPARPVRTATGRPLIALAGLVTCWTGARLAVWELPEMPTAVDRAPTRLIEMASVAGASSFTSEVARVRTARFRPVTTEPKRVTPVKKAMRSRIVGGTVPSSLHSATYPSPASGKGAVIAIPASVSASARSAASTPTFQAVVVAAPTRQAQSRLRRWSADAWLALRQGSAAPDSGRAAVPLYGASQAGAVLRYDLAPGSSRRPAAYVRAVQPLTGARESELATGLAARPLTGVPLTTYAEARLSRRGDDIELRPAVFLTAGLDDVPLPLGVRARAYAQAGYVGGRNATGFADGSVVAERRLLRRGATEIGGGVGLWGGAQRGAARLDLGPSAGLRFPLGEGTGRLAVDYRFRVAGNASPASGAALTLSAGF